MWAFISPMDCMDLVKFFMIFIFKIPPNCVCVDSYREPMQADISPIFCMAFTMFFFIDIINILLKPK